MTDEEMKKFVDTASYQQLLYLHRFEPLGSLWFTGGMGKYIYDRMSELRKAMTQEEFVSISKNLGW